MLKRAHAGTFHKMSPKHLNRDHPRSLQWTPLGARKQTRSQRAARGKILEAMTSGALANRYGMTVVADDPELVDDPTGDSLEALLCTVQAAWAWRNRGRLFDGPRTGIDPREGWIADPDAVEQPEDGA